MRIRSNLCNLSISPNMLRKITKGTANQNLTQHAAHIPHHNKSLFFLPIESLHHRENKKNGINLKIRDNNH